MTNKFYRSVFIILLVLLSACSRSKPKKQVELGGPRREIPVIYHQVRYAGETIALIAKWYTGDAKNWRAIAEVNPDINVDKIFLDDVIRIPKSLAKRTDPYSQSVLRAMQRGASKVPPVDGGFQQPSGPDVGYPEPGEPGLEPAGSREGSKQQRTEPKNVQVTRPVDAEAAAKRQELQEKTRYELLQQMIDDEGK